MILSNNSRRDFHKLRPVVVLLECTRNHYGPKFRPVGEVRAFAGGYVGVHYERPNLVEVTEVRDCFTAWD